jgi:hypothetical protein
VYPLTITSFVRGNLKWGLAALTHSVDADVASKVSSTSGGRAFLGTMPGSLLDVKNKKIKFCNKFKTVFQRRDN